MLSIDPATKTGWAISKDLYGTWELKTRKDESWGMKLIRFESKLREVIVSQNVAVVAYERPGGRNTVAIITQSKIIGVLEKVCTELKIEYRAYSSGEIKSFATGKGNAGKEAVINGMKEKYGYPGTDDNEADAMALLFLAKRDLGYGE